MGSALKQTFDVLNINRMQSGIDTYGQGRCPYYLEPSVIVVITDGGRLSNMQGVQEDVRIFIAYLYKMHHCTEKKEFSQGIDFKMICIVIFKLL